MRRICCFLLAFLLIIPAFATAELDEEELEFEDLELDENGVPVEAADSGEAVWTFPVALEDMDPEYIILAKKGTSAANVMSEAMRKNEAELTIAQNTKLRIIKAELDGDAKIISGNKYSWKIYMVTVPEGDSGIKL